MKQTVFLCGKSDLLCMSRFEQAPRPTAVFVVWRREKTRWVRCPARRTQAPEPRLTVSGLAAKRRRECARANLSWYLVFHFVTDCCCCCTAVGVVYEYSYVSAKRCVPSALLLVSRSKPAPGDCSLATEGRAARRPSVGREATSLAHHPTHRSFCRCCLLSWVTF